MRLSRRCGRQAHFAASRLPESPRDPRRVRRKLRRSDAGPLQHAEPAREFGDGAAQCRFADRDARTGRRARPLRDRIGDGRTRDQAEIGPRPAPHSSTSRRSTRAPACRSRRGICSSACAPGAEKFGWSKRTPGVGSMKRDGLTLGWGMAACILAGGSLRRRRHRRSARRRHGARRLRHAGHRHRHLHDPRAARGRADRPPARQDRSRCSATPTLPPGRFRAARWRRHR